MWDVSMILSLSQHASSFGNKRSSPHALLPNNGKCTWVGLRGVNAHEFVHATATGVFQGHSCKGVDVKNLGYTIRRGGRFHMPSTSSGTVGRGNLRGLGHNEGA